MTNEADDVKRDEPHAEPNEDANNTSIPTREAAYKDGANDASRVSGGESSHRDKVALFDKDGFQWVVASVLVLITAALSVAMFTLVSDAKDAKAYNGEWVMAFFTVLMGLFGVLITGLFVFMAFRIDRGAKLEAQRAAMEAAQRAAKGARSAARKRAEKVAAKMAQEVAAECAKKVATEWAEEAAVRAKEAAIERAQEVAENEVQKVAAKNSSDTLVDLAKFLIARSGSEYDK